MNGDAFVSQCRLGCWALGIGAGIVAMYLITSQTGFLAALLVAIALAVFSALVLQLLFCWADEEEEGNEYDESAVPAPPQGKPLSAPVATVASAPVTKPATKPAPKPKAKPAAKPKAKAKPAPKVEPTPDYDKDGVLEGENEGTRPAGLSAARGGKADNLKEIKGVGPKLEKMLNEMGFYHFDQIAGWSADEVAWVNANLKGFKGRVTRDDWIAQAKILAAGGETEFSKRVDDGDVY